MPSTQRHAPPRFLLAAAGAFVIAVSLQLIMQALIASPRPIAKAPEVLVIDPVVLPPEEPVTPLPTTRPPPPPMPLPPSHKSIGSAPPLVTPPPPDEFFNPAKTVSSRLTIPSGEDFDHRRIVPDTAARPHSIIRPLYPHQAIRAGREGRVTAEFMVLSNGQTDRARILSVEPRGYDFDKAVLKALYDARFAPAVRDGKPVETRVRQTFEFTLD